MFDLDAYVLKLLKFIEDSVAEALANPSAMLEPLSEADCALRVLKRTLLREDQIKNADLMLIGVFDYHFVDIAHEIPANPTQRLQGALSFVMRAKRHFSASHYS
jgi:hypothetical protein